MMPKKYTKNVYVSNGTPSVSIYEVEVLHGDIVRPTSKKSGWVRHNGPLFASESEARIAAISDLDVLSAKVSNLRAALARKSFHEEREKGSFDAT